MAYNQLPDTETLRKLLRYDGATGRLYWLYRGPEWFTTKSRPAAWHAAIWNTKHAGKEVGSDKKGDGYIRVALCGKRYFAHRIIMAMHLGREPREIDHINGDRTDNRLENLREVTRAENNMNRRRSRANKSGVIGVRFLERIGRWQAFIKTAGKEHFLGSYSSFNDAKTARKAAERLLGFHENHGREGKKSEIPQISPRRP